MECWYARTTRRRKWNSCNSLNGWRLTVSSTHSLVVQLNFVYIARNRQSRRIAPQMIPLHYIPFMAFRIYRIWMKEWMESAERKKLHRKLHICLMVFNCHSTALIYGALEPTIHRILLFLNLWRLMNNMFLVWVPNSRERKYVNVHEAWWFMIVYTKQKLACMPNGLWNTHKIICSRSLRK